MTGEIAWIDGTVVPRGNLTMPVGDAGFVLGATVTEQFRTFRGELFLPEEHARRLAESLIAVGIEPAMPVAAIMRAAADVAAHNHRLGTAHSDLGVVAFVTPGDLPAQHDGRAGAPRAMVHSFPLAFPLWAAAYDAGVALRTVAVRQVPEACWPIRAKTRSRLHYFLADREAAAAEPGARAVLAYADGRISETSTANIAVVRDGTILTPPATDALAGISLGFARRLAAGLGFDWHEASLTAADLAAADEILLTSTPSCILPATRFDGAAVGTGRPGPAFRSILDGWSTAVGLDIRDQAVACSMSRHGRA